MKSLDGGVYFQMVKLLFPLSFACLLTGFSFTLTKNVHFFFLQKSVLQGLHVDISSVIPCYPCLHLNSCMTVHDCKPFRHQGSIKSCIHLQIVSNNVHSQKDLKNSHIEPEQTFPFTLLSYRAGFLVLPQTAVPSKIPISSSQQIHGYSLLM